MREGIKDRGNQKRRNITIEDIRSKYPKEKGVMEKYGLWSHVLRPISYYLAWLFIRVGISANNVTGISIPIGFVGCVLLAFGSYTNMIIGALILNIWALLEYVDGAVARGTDSCSDYGKFIDNLNYFFLTVIFFISAGIGAYNHPDPHLSLVIQFFPPITININRDIFLVLGGLCAAFYILPILVGDSFSSIFSQRQRNVVDRAGEDLFGNALYKVAWLNIPNTTGIIMPILLLVVIFKFLGFFLFFYALMMVCYFIGTTMLILRKAKKYGEELRGYNK